MNIRVPWTHNINICRASCSLRHWTLVPWSPLWWTPILRKSATRFLRPVRFHAIFFTAFFCWWCKCSNCSFNIDNFLELVSCLSFKIILVSFQPVTVFLSLCDLCGQKDGKSWNCTIWDNKHCTNTRHENSTWSGCRVNGRRISKDSYSWNGDLSSDDGRNS